VARPPAAARKERWRSLEALAALSRTLPALRGKANLGWRLMRLSEKRGGLQGSWRISLRDGTTLELPRQSRMTWAVAFEGYYDHAEVQHVKGFIRPGSVVLDVGASIGLWTVQLGRVAASRDARLWAFEPNPANTSWLRRNVALNDLSETVTVCEMGLGDRSESSALSHTEHGLGSGAVTVDGEEGIPITLARLDDIDLPAPVSFIKIDVEGYEPAFLRGAGELIGRDRPVIFGEFSLAWLRARGEDLRAALADLDYEITALERLRPAAWRPSVIVPRRIDRAASEPLPENLLLCPR
jgi:FkbM family methyltransferase